MLLRSLVATLALTAYVVKGSAYSPEPRPASAAHVGKVVHVIKGTRVVKGTYHAPRTRPASVAPVSTLTDVTSVFGASANLVVNLGPTFKDACKTGNTDVIVRRLVDIRSLILDLAAKIHLGVGLWIGANINVFVDLYVNLLLKLQVLLKIIVAGGQTDACRSSIISLASPLKVVLAVFINAGVDVYATIGARVDLDLLASIGVSLGIYPNVGAGAILGSGSSANTSAVVPASTDVSAKFNLCVDLIVKLGPSFEYACKTQNTTVIINGLVDLKALIVDLGAQLSAGVGVWVGAAINVFVNLYVQLLVKLQVLLKIISAGGQTNSCRDTILSLKAPLKVILNVFINAGIDVYAAISALVDLDFLASIGISLGINAQVGGSTGANVTLPSPSSGTNATVGVNVTVGSGSGANTSAVVPASTDVSAKFNLCVDLIVKLGPSFEDACKTQNTTVIINGLVDLKALLVDLGAQLSAGVGVWVGVAINVFVNLYVQLLVKLQVLLKIISAGGQTYSCRDSILSLNAPLKVILTVFINAGINVQAAIGALVDLDFLASIGISLGITAQVGALLGNKVGSALGGLPKLKQVPLDY